MGNTSSNPNSSTDTHIETNISTLPYLIDDIALHYVLTQNSIDLTKITDPEYHDNLIILTSNVLEKRLNNLEIGYLQNRITGKEDQFQDIIPANSKVKDKIIMNISKFYIKIIMIYSAIVSTVDPQYSYVDENGSTKTFYLKESDEYKKIPKNVKPTLVQLSNPVSLCRKRLNILKNRYDDTSEPGSVILNPGEKLCSNDSTVKLTDEIGIKELDSLYYDIFDYNTKKWNKKSNKMKKKYNKDLILFYRIFTGKKNKPSNIKSFQDIELLDFKTISSCSDNTFLSDIVISKENKLIKEYKEKIDLIQKNTEDNRNKLYNVLKELFVIKTVDDEQSYSINPSITLDKILLLEEQTRNIILDLYISCEKYFIQALIIFENIYESKNYTISEYRKENLMNLPQQEASLNYKDTLTIPPPFSPNVSLEGYSVDPMTPPQMTPPQMTPPPMTPPQMTPPQMTPPQMTPPQMTPPPMTPPPMTPQQMTPPPITPPPITPPPNPGFIESLKNLISPSNPSDNIDKKSNIKENTPQNPFEEKQTNGFFDKTKEPQKENISEPPSEIKLENGTSGLSPKTDIFKENYLPIPNKSEIKPNYNFKLPEIKNNIINKTNSDQFQSTPTQIESNQITTPSQPITGSNQITTPSESNQITIPTESNQITTPSESNQIIRPTESNTSNQITRPTESNQITTPTESNRSNQITNTSNQITNTPSESNQISESNSELLNKSTKNNFKNTLKIPNFKNK